MPSSAPRTEPRPSDDAIVLAMLLADASRPCADEVRGQLHRLGFDLKTQQVAGMLRRLSREDMAMVAVHHDAWTPLRFYEVTRYGWTQLGNRWPHLRPIIRERERR